MFLFRGDRRDNMMTMQETIDNVCASFEIEGLWMTPEDRKRGEAILSGKKTIDEVIRELKDELHGEIGNER